MIDLRNQNGVTLFAIAVTIIIMFVLTMVPLNLMVNNGGIIKQTKDAEIYTSISGVQERVSSVFFVDNNFDNSVKDLIEKEYIYKILNGSNEEIYWITKKGLENMASGYETNALDERMQQKILEGTIPEIEKGKIRINSIDDIMGTNIYVIDRNLNVAYISDEMYGEVEFIKSGTEPENIWWKKK